MNERYRRILGFLVWTIGAVFYVKALLVRLYNPDLWWHLAAGRAMVTQKTFLWTETFSHTLAGAPWINFEWLSELGLYALYALSGFWGLYAAKILLCAAVLALVFLTIHKMGLKGPWFFLLGWAGFKVLQPRLQDRPELATLLLMAIFVFLILRARAGRFSRLPAVLFGLMVLWVNLHGGFVFGVGVVFLFWIGALAEGRDPAFSRLLFHAFLAVLAGLLINPHGPKLAIIFWEHYQQMKTGAQLILEWRPPSVSDVPHFWMLYLAAAVALVGGFLKRWRDVRFWAPAVLVFAVWGSFFYRNAALFAFIGVPFLAAFLNFLFAERAWPKRPYVILTGWAICLLALFLEPAVFARPFPSDPVMSGRFPVAACRYVADKNIDGVMYNIYGDGGYIEWALGPERKVFMDGRYLFFPFLEKYVALMDAVAAGDVQGDGWRKYLSENGVTYAIMSYDETTAALSPLLLMFPRSEWALVFWDDSGLVFVKRTPERAAFIRTEEYATLRPYAPDQMRFLLATKTTPAEAVRRELERHEKEVGFSLRAGQMKSLLEEVR